MTPVEIVLHGPPKGKGRPRFNRQSGRAYTPAATVSFEGALRHAAAEAMGSRPLIEGPVKITMTAMFDVPKSWSKKKQAAALAGRIRPTGKPDFDNLVKTVDALNGIVWKDDAQIVDGFVHKHYALKPYLAIVVRSIEPPPDFLDL